MHQRGLHTARYFPRKLQQRMQQPPNQSAHDISRLQSTQTPKQSLQHPMPAQLDLPVMQQRRNLRLKLQPTSRQMRYPRIHQRSSQNYLRSLPHDFHLRPILINPRTNPITTITLPTGKVSIMNQIYPPAPLPSSHIDTPWMMEVTKARRSGAIVIARPTRMTGKRFMGRV